MNSERAALDASAGAAFFMQLFKEYRQFVELRLDGEARVRGHAAVFDKKSEDLGGFREVIKPGAFTDAIRRSDVRFLINHRGLPLARTKNRTLALAEDMFGLAIEANLDPTDPDVQRVLPKMRAGNLDQMSFGFSIEDHRKDEQWSLDSDGLRLRTILRVSQLYDVSPVTFPAYPQTDVYARAGSLDQSQFHQAQTYYQSRIEELEHRKKSVIKAAVERRERYKF